MTPPATTTQDSRPIDRQDERLRSGQGLRGVLASTLDRVRTGELGVLPVVIGLVVIGTIFQSLNSTFLSSANLGNLLMQSAAVGVIALGIVLILLLGEIDLSVGSVAGLSAATFAVLLMNHGWPLWACLLAAVASGTVIGLLYAVVFTRFGVPSFVITLAGLLTILGLQIKVLKPAGTINIPFDSPLVNFGQLWFVPPTVSYVLCLLVAAGYFLSRWRRAGQRRRAGLSALGTGSIGVVAALIFVASAAACWYLNTARGVGWMFVFFVALVLAVNHLLVRTAWGRSVYAVGGNREAARRAGIDVNRVYVSVFALTSTLAAVGGLLLAGRLASAAQSTGGNDVNLNAIAAAVIGGTSLFGGRGSAFSALLGILVIQSITSGLILLNLDSDVRSMVTGAVLLIAVTLDATSRRSRTARGRA